MLHGMNGIQIHELKTKMLLKGIGKQQDCSYLDYE